jgi:hypothetical protein
MQKRDMQLNATQSKLCIPIINRIYHKMKYGIQFPAIKVCEDLIIDGHHRYVSSLLAEITIPQIPSHRTNATKRIDWNELSFDANDWDTLSKIENLNRQDAENNNISIQIIEKITTNKI